MRLEGAGAEGLRLERHELLLLEDVERACRELRPLEERHYLAHNFNEEVVEVARRFGLGGMPIPPEYGGRGAGYLAYVLALERIGREGVGARTFFSGHTSLGQLTLLRWASEELKQRYLSPSTRCELVLAYALTEPGAGSNPRELSSEYTAEGTRYILNGEKYLISNGSIADALIVFAYPKGKREGMSAFVVDAKEQGVEAMRLTEKIGIPTSDTGYIRLRGVSVPKENLLGQEGRGLHVAFYALMNGRLSVAAGNLGVLQDLIDELSSYAKQGDGRLARQQPFQAALAEMAVDLEAGRALTYKAAEAKQLYESRPEDLELRRRADLLIAQAKFFTSQAAYRAARAAVSLLGPSSISFSRRAARHLVDVRVTRIYEGTDEILKLRIAQGLLGDEYRAFI
ncbi:MAG: hypothetical protein C4339_01870 [Nitrososphaerota archaeon]